MNRNFRVIQTIQGNVTDHEAPTEVQWYNGESHVEALAALAMAASKTDTEWYTVINVRMEF